MDNNENVKLCDFGFTREYEGKSSYLQTWCGTVCYSAPEMLKGEKYAGEKVDVWSLGIILYALLCGELPFDEDDENVTKMRILKEEPKFPETMPTGAKDLIVLLLSKRPLLRPTLVDILQNPWLAEHAPLQHEILKIQHPLPFTSQIEKDTLAKMHSAGANINQVVESVTSQRCDALAGWWALLLAREERREQRRSQRRKERESARVQKRASLAALALDQFTPKLDEGEEKQVSNGSVMMTSSQRGREPNRINGAREYTEECRWNPHGTLTISSRHSRHWACRSEAHRHCFTIAISQSRWAKNCPPAF